LGGARRSEAGKEDKRDPHAPLSLCVGCRFGMNASSDSDSDDGKRVVRSAKDRRFDELRATCDDIRVRLLRSSPRLMDVLAQ